MKFQYFFVLQCLLILNPILACAERVYLIDYYVQQSLEKAAIIAASALVGSEGKVVPIDSVVGKIYKNRSEADIYSLNLYDNKPIGLSATCDEDCKNIDLIAEKNGKIIDMTTTSKPYILLSASGQYNILVVIKRGSCIAYRCTYGIVVVGQIGTTLKTNFLYELPLKIW